MTDPTFPELRARRIRCVEPAFASMTGWAGVDGAFELVDGTSRWRVPLLIYSQFLAIAACEDADTGEALDATAIMNAVWSLPGDPAIVAELGADEVFDPRGDMIARTIYDPTMLRAIWDGARQDALGLPQRTPLEAMALIARGQGHTEVPTSYPDAVRIICGVEADHSGRSIAGHAYTRQQLEGLADLAGLPPLTHILGVLGLPAVKSIEKAIATILDATGSPDARPTSRIAA